MSSKRQKRLLDTVRDCSTPLSKFCYKKLPFIFSSNAEEFISAANISGDSVLRLAHQPNFLCSVSILDQIMLGSDLSQKGLCRFEYLYLDYDTCENKRYRTGYLLKKTNGNDQERVNLPCDKPVTMFSQKVPPEEWIKQSAEKIRISILVATKDRSQYSSLTERLDNFLDFFLQDFSCQSKTSRRKFRYNTTISR